MTTGKLRHYYWQIYSLLAENAHLLDTDHPEYVAPEESMVTFGNRLMATLVFVDGSCLIVRALLDDTTAVQEYNYAYVYLNAGGEGVLQYDDAPHHPSISTHPHHKHNGRRPIQGQDAAYELDISRVSFATVLTKIIAQYVRPR